ncbi:MAG TPA: ParB/RepB/Spo0J family partition protein [Afifellaceae bacterium]|nr:ParB/RepB/Spo0J family partition protein [Afifellaceae bacterium]
MAATGEANRRLGRGLDALLGVYGPTAEQRRSDGGGPRTIPLALIHPNPRNPRREFNADELDNLAASLRTHGLVQPIVVRPVGEGERYEIIAGERRWRAAQKAGLHEVPVTILAVSDSKALELAIVENVQRTDLNPVEEALGYQALMEEFDYTQADLGAAVGKSRAHVANTLRLLKLPPPVLEALERGALSAGHARALITAPDPEGLARKIVARGLSVREAEKLAQRTEDGETGARRRTETKDADTRALEKELSDALGLRLELRHRPDGGGEMRIHYRDLDQLEALCRKLRR